MCWQRRLECPISNEQRHEAEPNIKWVPYLMGLHGPKSRSPFLPLHKSQYSIDPKRNDLDSGPFLRGRHVHIRRVKLEEKKKKRWDWARIRNAALPAGPDLLILDLPSLHLGWVELSTCHPATLPLAYLHWYLFAMAARKETKRFILVGEQHPLIPLFGNKILEEGIQGMKPTAALLTHHRPLFTTWVGNSSPIRCQKRIKAVRCRAEW